MKIIYNNIIPVKGFTAINLFGLVFVRRKGIVTPEVINHEQIHLAQMKELLFIGFYVFYIIEWLVKLLKYGKKSYFNISFEREAYLNDTNLQYLSNRKRYSFLKFL